MRNRRMPFALPFLPSVPLLILVLAVSACAFGEFRPEDPFQRQYSLEGRHKRYSDLVRWSKFEEASSFMEKDSRKDFVAHMPDFDQVRFTDWEASPWQLDEELRSTTIEVTYRGYSMVSLIELKVREKQEWTRTGKGNLWTVKSSFEGLDRLAGR